MCGKIKICIKKYGKFNFRKSKSAGNWNSENLKKCGNIQIKNLILSKRAGNSTFVNRKVREIEILKISKSVGNWGYGNVKKYGKIQTPRTLYRVFE